mgnify:CR=1 FL=1
MRVKIIVASALDWSVIAHENPDFLSKRSFPSETRHETADFVARTRFPHDVFALITRFSHICFGARTLNFLMLC